MARRRARAARAALVVLAAGIAGCAAGAAASRPAPAPAPVSRPAARVAAPAAPAPARRGVRVPILMYHVIERAPPGTANPRLWVPARSFTRQMRALERRGWHAVTLAQVFDHWRRGRVLPRRAVVVSFDDGYRSQWARAARTLRALGWPGVLNLTLDNVAPDGLSERHVRDLIADGWEVDSHTLTHPDLTTLDDDALAHEVAGSRAELRHRFGVRASFFCYPSGRWDGRVAAAVRAAGYRGATTVAAGVAAPGGDPYGLPRLRVDPDTTVAQLLSRMRA